MRTSYTKQLYRTIKHYRLDNNDDELAQACYLIEHNLMTERVARALMFSIELSVQDAIDFPNVLHRPPTAEQLDADGPPDIELGHLIDAPDLRFGVRVKDEARSILLAGNAGSGKTTATLNTVRGVHQLNEEDPEHHRSLLLFDRKLDFLQLVEELAPAFVLVDVHDPDTHFGLEAPDKMPPNVWVNIVATMFSARAGMIAAWTCFANIIRWLLPILNPTPAEPLIWPSLKLILQVARKAPLSAFSAKPDYMGTLIQALEAATQATHLFDCFGGVDLDSLIQQRKSVVIAMPNMQPNWLRRFFIDLQLARILHGRIHRREKVDGMSLMIVMDEADQDARAKCDEEYETG